MNNIETLRDKDDEIFAKFEEISPVIYELPKIDKFKKTGNAMLSLFSKLGFLKTGILDVAETGNVYTFNILFRSFLEHMLRANYIFMRWADEKTDEPGEEYFSLKPLEEFEYIKAWNWAVRKSGGKMEKSPKAIFKEIYPDIDNERLIKLEEIQSKFRYRQIIQSINSILNESEINILHKIVPTYSQLSSFTHGGPYTDALLEEYLSETDREKYLYETSDMTVMMFYSFVRWLFLMLAGIDDKYNSHLVKIHETISKYY